MAKQREGLPPLMDTALGAPKPAPTAGYADDTETVVISLRLHRQRKEALQRLFAAKGMDMSTGLRMVAYEWLEGQR